MEDYLPEAVPLKKLDRLEMKVNIPWGTPKERLAKEIADRICKGLI